MARPDGEWIETFTHRQFWPMDPDPTSICIADIAHALSQQVRYTGHTPEPYTVAQHSVLVARFLSNHGAINRVVLWGLLHDAAEAYCIDLPRPIKRQLPAYSEAEARVQAAICDRFGLPAGMPPEVREADDILLASEAAVFFPPATRPGDWHLRCAPDPFVVENLYVWPHREAEEVFLTVFALWRQS